MVGLSLVDKMRAVGFSNLLVPSSQELNLTRQKIVEEYFCGNKIDYVFHLAGKVGGIAANMASPAEFLFNNLLMAANITEAARKSNIKKLLFLGSSCIYPRECPQPMKEEYLLAGKPEPTNEGYALAKITGLKLCEFYNKQYGTNFISLMPCNLYGPNDHFGRESSHVMPALIARFVTARNEGRESLEVWGTGKPKREFLYVDDLSDAMLFFMNKYNANDLPAFVNIGSGADISIKDLTFLIKDNVGYKGEIKFDPSKPDGMPIKLLDTEKGTRLGWKAHTSLKEGIKKTISWYLSSGQKK